MLIKKFIFPSLSLILFSLIFSFSAKAQENPGDDKILIDSIDQSENLLDSNEVYKKQFDSLSKDGDWLKVNKSDFIRDLESETGEDLDFPPTDEVIYVWRPFCATQYWNPYLDGRWVFSSYGWIWVSDYSWGWGPYNYGRWYCSNIYGWIWLPGNYWAVNWVSWRCNDYYVGWYPTCPRLYWRNYWNHVCTNHLFASAPTHWIFVNRTKFTKPINTSTIVSVNENANILKTTTKVKTAIYSDPGMPKVKYNGPDVKEISKVSGEKITPKDVEVTNEQHKQSTDGNTVSSYKKDDGKQVRSDGSRTKTNGTKQTQTQSKGTTRGYKYNGTKRGGTTKTPGKRSDNNTTPQQNEAPKQNEGAKESNVEKSTQPDGNNNSKSNDGSKGNLNGDRRD